MKFFEVTIEGCKPKTVHTSEWNMKQFVESARSIGLLVTYRAI